MFYSLYNRYIYMPVNNSHSIKKVKLIAVQAKVIDNTKRTLRRPFCFGDKIKFQKYSTLTLATYLLCAASISPSVAGGDQISYPATLKESGVLHQTIQEYQFTYRNQRARDSYPSALTCTPWKNKWQNLRTSTRPIRMMAALLKNGKYRSTRIYWLFYIVPLDKGKITKRFAYHE